MATTGNIMARIAKVLNYPIDGPWNVTDFDTQTGLYMVSYFTGENLAETNQNNRDRVRPPPMYENLRGTIIRLGADLTGADDHLYADTYRFTPRAVTDRLLVRGDGLDLTTQYGDRMHIETNGAYIRRFREGVIIRCFRCNGVDHFATSGRLQAKTGKWGNSPEFYAMYLEMGGLPLDQLFGDATDTDVYVFLLAHPLLQMVSLRDPGGVVLLGVYADGSPLPNLDGGRDPTIAQRLASFVSYPQPLTIAEANQHLEYGTFGPIPASGDTRLGPGESVIITSRGKTITVMSGAADWRAGVRGNTPMIYQRFFQLLDSRTLSPETYQRNWPIIGDFNINTIWGRTLNTHMCLVAASPINRRDEVFGYLIRLFGRQPQGNYTVDPASVDPTSDIKPYEAEVDDRGIYEVGEIFGIYHYLVDCVAKFRNRTLPRVSKQTIHVLESLVRNIKPDGERSIKQLDQTAIFIMLLRPYGNSIKITGAGLYTIYSEMKTAHHKAWHAKRAAECDSKDTVSFGHGFPPARLEEIPSMSSLTVFPPLLGATAEEL